MKPAVRLLLYLLVLAALLAGTVIGYRALAARQKKSKVPTAALRAIPVRVAPVGRATLRDSVVLNADIEPLLQVNLAPRIAGRLERLGDGMALVIREGAAVKAGDVVAELDHRDLDAQVTAAAAAVATAEASVRAAEVAAADTARERRRAENLLTLGSVTEQARDRAVTADERAAAALAQAQAQRDQAKAALLSAEVLRGEAVLRAPFDGVVAAKYADPGAMVSAATPLLRLVSRELRMLAPVPTRHLPALAGGGATAEVEVDVRPGRAYPAEIGQVFPEVNAATRTATLELRLPPGDGPDREPPLKPGMHGSLRIVLDTRENVLAVPSDAVIRVRDRTLVFLAREGKAEARTIKPGLREGALLEVLEGLREGDPLIVAGQQRLTDGAAVEIRDSAAAEPGKAP